MLEARDPDQLAHAANGREGASARPSAPKPIFLVPRKSLNPTERKEEVIRRPSYPALVESMGAAGRNTVPIFVSRPKPDGTRDVYDGNSRSFSAEENEQDELLAIEVDEDLDEVGLIDFGANHNGVRRAMTPEEWAIKAERLMELTGCSQDQAARRLKRSPASVSRYLAALSMPDKHAAAGRKLCGSVRCLIAAIKENAIQDQVMAFATANTAAGRPPSRAAVELMIKRLKAEHRPGPKPKYHEVPLQKGSLIASYKLKEDGSLDLAIEDAKAILKLLIGLKGEDRKVIVARLQSPRKKRDDPPAASPAVS